MNSIREDAELASEMVVLLGRELKSARNTISELQQQVEQNDDGGKLKELKRSKKEARKKVKELEKAAEASQTRVAELELAEQEALGRIQSLEQALQEQKVNRENSSHEEELEVAVEKARKQVDELREQEKTAIQHIQQLEMQNQELRKTTKELEHANEIANARITGLEAAHRDSTKKLGELEEATQLARKRVAELESVDKTRVNELQLVVRRNLEREKVFEQQLSEQRKQHAAAESTLQSELRGAESAIKILKLNIERIGYQNRWLHGELQRVTVKQEEPEECSKEGSSSDSDRSSMSEAATKQDGINVKTDPLCRSCDELKRQVKELSDEKASILARPENQDSTMVSIYHGLMVDINILWQCPPPVCRPEFQQLMPVCSRDADLSTYLASDSHLSRASQNFIYFPGRLQWYEPKVHAIVFGPRQVYDKVQQRWINAEEFKCLHGRIRELFFADESSVYYAGSYKCYRTSPGVGGTSEDILHAVADTALVPDRETIQSQSYDLDKRKLLKEYQDGVVTMDCLALQCVNFNPGLYSALLQRFAQVTPLKRKGLDDLSRSDMGACAVTKKAKPSLG